MKVKYTNQVPLGAQHLTEKSENLIGINPRQSPVVETMRRYMKPMLLASTAAITMCLSSCVIPYDSPGYSNNSYSGYQNGYRVSALPSGYRSESISGNTYYYHDGYYYRRDSNGYIVTDAPRTSRYYTDYDRMRQSRYSTQSSNRQIYDRRESVLQLPSGYRTVEYRGQQYYKYGDRYYVRESGRYYIAARPY
jgi:hypothetical protein